MKKILLSCAAFMMFLVSGCGNQVNYERNTETGRVEIVQFADMQEKMDNQDTFVMAFSQTNCSHCIAFREEVLPDYIVDHGFTFYEVLLDIQDTMDPLYQFVKDHPNPSKFLTSTMDPESIYTPTFYFVENGEVKDIWIGEISYEEFDDLIIKYQLDKVVE